MTGPTARRWRVAVRPLGVAALCTALPARPTTPDPWPVLDHASATYQTIATLAADFVQVVVNPMVGVSDTTRGRLYQRRPGRFAMRFAEPKGDRIVADGRYLWLYTPSTTPGQVIRSRIPESGTTGPNLIGQFVERPRERYSARYVRADSLPDGVVDVVALQPKANDQPYREATLSVGRADGLVRRLEIAETSGQMRTVLLRNLTVTGRVPSREFTFSPPGG
ncbi:MAG TPA: outer membrane lipoprotein carrier protein LolA, partial [Gemmatimonadales bacterium]|nr:outer membrane lipoprotein carrier protein LolA [Gemmatimonadales bacterium]